MSHVAYLSHRLNKLIVEAPRNSKWAAAINYVIPASDRVFRDGVWVFKDKWYSALVTITEYHYPHFSNLVSTKDFKSLEDHFIPAEEWGKRWAKFQINLLREAASNTEEPSSRYDFDEFRFKPINNGPHSKLYLTSNAPPEVVKAAYRALSKLYHPDHGGDSDVFKEIKKAYEEIIS